MCRSVPLERPSAKAGTCCFMASKALLTPSAWTLFASQVAASWVKRAEARSWSEGMVAGSVVIWGRLGWFGLER